MKKLMILLVVLTNLQGCAGVNTFPTIARAGDTVSLMVGGSEQARKNTISAILTDSNGIQWDLQNLGLIKSVFNVRADGLSKGLYYSSELELLLPWAFGHEPIQTVMVVDLPDVLPAGASTIQINTNTSDNSSGIGPSFTLALEILAGTGSSDPVLYNNAFTGLTATDFTKMESAPHAKIKFGTDGTEIFSAASLVVDFDETILDPKDIAVYSPPTTIRQSGAGFNESQHMVYWHHDGQKLYIDLIAPLGIPAMFTNLYIIHPDNITGSANFFLESSNIYNNDGTTTSLPVNLEYFQQ